MIRISRHGYRMLAMSAALMCVAAALMWLYVHPIAITAPLVLFVLLALFFRDPERAAPPGDHLVLSPADGTVVDIEQVDEWEFVHGRTIRIGIFLSVFNVHVNRAPVAGAVRHLYYRPGKKHPAFRAKAAILNESNSIGLESSLCAGCDAPVRILVKQIAGVIARRIVCSCRTADRLVRGERIGMIKFGSRTELYLPCAAVTELRVKIGDRVRGGSTVLGALGSDGGAALDVKAREGTAGSTAQHVSTSCVPSASPPRSPAAARSHAMTPSGGDEMQTFLDCVPCFARQALDAVRFVSEDEVLHERVLRRVLDAMSTIELDKPPPHMGRQIHRIVREETRSPDPYAEIKHRSTETARASLPFARERIDAASNPFEAAVRFAIAGNVMDFALSAAWDEERIRAAFAEALTRPIVRSEVGRLEEDAETAALILYIGDNAGEAVLDGLLLERLPRGRVTYVVKGAPVVNDATREDALTSGIGELARIIDTGSDAPGVILQDASKEFRDLFGLADLVIAKGQANYESLSGSREGIYFLTQVKCPVIARDAGASVGDWLCQGSTVRADAREGRPT